MTVRISRRVICMLIAIAALAGGVLVYHGTARGPGIGGDATIYISSARNLLAGEGLGLVGPRGEFRLLPYFPPFFPLALAALGALGADLVVAARWLNALVFSAIILLAGAATMQVVRRAWLALALSLLLAFSPVLIPIYAWAMSEPLAILLGFLALILLQRYLDPSTTTPDGADARHGLPWLVLSALAAGLSFLTRYIAVGFIGAGIMMIVIARGVPARRRLRSAVSYGLISGLPMAAWVVIDLVSTATVASRRMDFTSLGDRLVGFWQDTSLALLGWFIPDSWVLQPPYPGGLNQIIVPLAGLAVLAWALWLFSRLHQAGQDNYARALMFLSLAVFSLVFVAAVMLVKITTYPPITINLRMLSPLHVSVLWLLVLAMDMTLEAVKGKTWLSRAFTAALIIGMAWYAVRAVNIADALHRNGLGYTMPEWQESETMQAVRELPEDTLIITNQDMAVLALTGRASYPVKEVYFDEPVEPFTRYGDGDLANDEPQQLFREGEAVLVLFDTIDDQFAGLYGERTAERIQVLVTGLQRAFRGSDGGIFYYEIP